MIDLILVSICLILFFLATLLLRDLRIVDQNLRLGDTHRKAIFPVTKSILSGLDAVKAYSSIVGKDSKKEELYEISKGILDQLAKEVALETQADGCYLKVGSVLGCSSEKLEKVSSTIREFLDDVCNSRFLNLPQHNSTSSIVSMGALHAVGFSYYYLDEIPDIQQSIILALYDTDSRDLTKIAQTIQFLGREIKFRHNFFNLSTQLSQLLEENSLIKRNLQAVAHDAKSPLQTLNLILSRIKVQNPENKLLNLGTMSIKFLEDIIFSFLDTDGLDSPSDQQVDIRMLTEEVITLLQPIAEAREKQIVLDCQDNFSVKANAIALKRVVLNLLTNSLKYSRGEIIKITILNNFSQRLIISDKDSNPNLEAFNFSGQAQPAAPISKSINKSWGIGLSSVKRLCEKNNLKIFFQKNDQNGLDAILEFSPQLEDDPLASLE